MAEVIFFFFRSSDYFMTLIYGLDGSGAVGGSSAAEVAGNSLMVTVTRLVVTSVTTTSLQLDLISGRQPGPPSTGPRGGSAGGAEDPTSVGGEADVASAGLVSAGEAGIFAASLVDKASVEGWFCSASALLGAEVVEEVFLGPTVEHGRGLKGSGPMHCSPNGFPYIGSPA